MLTPPVLMPSIGPPLAPQPHHEHEQTSQPEPDPLPWASSSLALIHDRTPWLSPEFVARLCMQYRATVAHPQRLTANGSYNVPSQHQQNLLQTLQYAGTLDPASESPNKPCSGTVRDGTCLPVQLLLAAPLANARPYSRRVTT